jgi:membrane protease YdiL (CAAX protease family)
VDVVSVKFGWILFFAMLLLWTSFSWQPLDFWIVFPISLVILSAIAIFFSRIPIKRKPPLTICGFALLSGLFLYGLFAFGKWLITLTGIPLLASLETLYDMIRPTEWWHYFVLFVFIIPGEELFWRGYVVGTLHNQMSEGRAIIFGALLYGIVHAASSSLLLVLAAFLAGLVWGWLFVRTKSIWPPLLSHLLFDALLLIWLPLM